MAFRLNYLNEHSRFIRDDRGWLIITKHFVFATGIYARVFIH